MNSCLVAIPVWLAMTAANLGTGGTIAAAGEVSIEHVDVNRTGATWRFSVTIRHADEGWDHFADLWQVVDGHGTVLGERILAHPHVDEQPFTRSLGGVEIPGDVTTVFIRARDSRHGLSSQLYEVRIRR